MRIHLNIKPLLTWRRVSTLLALILLGLAFFKPYWYLPRTIYQYVVILDITQSMNTRDINIQGRVTDRLTLSKQAIQHALTQLPCGSRIGLGLYTANNVYQLFNPLDVCEHYDIIQQALQRIDWRMAWANDSQIQYGLFAGLELLMESPNPSQLVFISDGDESPKSDRQPAFMGEKGKPGGLLIGVGSTTPSPVPHLAADNSIRGYWTMEEALNITTPNASRSPLYLSQLDEGNLKRLAELTGLYYQRLEQPQSLITLLTQSAFGKTLTVNTDIRWLFALGALLLYFSPLLYSLAKKGCFMFNLIKY